MSVDEPWSAEWINEKIEAETAKHDAGEEHESSWCGACWWEAHADEFPEEVVT